MKIVSARAYRFADAPFYHLGVYNDDGLCGWGEIDVQDERLLPPMLEWIACKSAGSIVLITSNHHLVAFPGGSAYGSMKEMLEKFGKHAAYELAPYKIRVNCIAPGQTHNYKPRQQG